MARNFYTSGQNILYPQIDWSGNAEGFVESEFLLYQYLISLLYHIFGVEEFIGRLFSVIASLFIIFGLYLIVKKILGEQTAFIASLVYSVLPLNIYFNKAFMPETTMKAFSVWGIYFL
jgi:4-amino-4-deoxy-L-arabinose transferase-like glycosyltransferase